VPSFPYKFTVSSTQELNEDHEYASMKLFTPALAGLVALVVASPTESRTPAKVAANKYENDGTHM
jgi:hypothetical protein